MLTAAATIPPIAFVEARHFTRTRLRPQTQGIVIHATAGAEGPLKAEQCAAMMAAGWEDPAQWRSAHEVCDSNSIVRMVPLDRRAYHCGQNGNDAFLGIELCGAATQTDAQWRDAVSLPMLQLAIRRFAELCKQFNVPPRYVDFAAVHRGDRGITTHLDIRRAWAQTTHTDPGPGFPLADFIEAVRVCLATMA